MVNNTYRSIKLTFEKDTINCLPLMLAFRINNLSHPTSDSLLNSKSLQNVCQFFINNLTNISMLRMGRWATYYCGMLVLVDSMWFTYDTNFVLTEQHAFHLLLPFCNILSIDMNKPQTSETQFGNYLKNKCPVLS